VVKKYEIFSTSFQTSLLQNSMVKFLFYYFFSIFLGECSKKGSFEWFLTKYGLGHLGVNISHHG